MPSKEWKRTGLITKYWYQSVPDDITYEQTAILHRCARLLLPSIVNDPDAFDIQFGAPWENAPGYWAIIGNDLVPPKNVRDRVENLARTLVLGVLGIEVPREPTDESLAQFNS